MIEFKYIKSSFIFFVLVVVLNVECFNYEEKGPDTWPINIKNCDGKTQSPINIEDWNAVYDHNLLPVNFINYDNVVQWNVSHDGKAGQVFTPLVNKTDALKISGSNFNEVFELLQFHFHWGENDYQGSEHLIDGKKYPLELHLVHLSPENKIAVLGFLFTLSPEDVDNPALDELLRAISTVRKRPTSTKTQFKLSKILPLINETTNYYRYAGSLTNPPCTEGLVWTVFETPIEISVKQMKNFRLGEIKKNFRPVQKLNNRTVYSSREIRRPNENPVICMNDGISFQASLLSLITLFVVYLCFN